MPARSTAAAGAVAEPKGYRPPEDDEDEPLHAQADLFQYVCAGLLFAGLVGYAAYLNHKDGGAPRQGRAAGCARRLAEKLCRGGKLHVSGDELSRSSTVALWR